ncbi:hypothetical protein [Prosthecobacter sp.]|uniref:hypothetical protein n=1 Tax=Prosthecobacter sp. TaxID=1965333 RepID=UPI0037847DD3
MDMQVSWIDAEQLKALVEQIAPEKPREDGACGLVEIDTVPETSGSGGEKPWGFAMDWMEAPEQRAPAALEMTEALAAEPVLLKAETEAGEMVLETLETVEESSADEEEPPMPMPPAALPLSRIRDKLRAIRQRATEAGILTRPMEVAAVDRAPENEKTDAETTAAGSDRASTKEGTSAVPVFEVPAGTREVRLAAFAAWTRKVLQEDGGHVLVMSDEGEVLWGGESKAGLVLSTMMAWGAAVRASAMSACETPPVIHQTLASGNVLTVIPCDTAVGMVHAAVAAPAGLTREQAGLLRRGLCAVMG